MSVLPSRVFNCRIPSLLLPLLYLSSFFSLLSAITLDNTLVILSTVAPDAGRYYVQAVNDKNGENKTSQPITLSVESESPHTVINAM